MALERADAGKKWRQHPHLSPSSRNTCPVECLRIGCQIDIGREMSRDEVP